MAVYIFMLGWVIIWGIMSQITARQVCIGNEVYEKRVNLFMAFVTFSVKSKKSPKPIAVPIIL